MRRHQFNIAVVAEPESWIAPYAAELADRLQKAGNELSQLSCFDTAKRFDIVFLLGYGKIVPAAALKNNKHTLVVHESALPKGRGWSPLTWQILAGESEIPITLFEAAEAVDSGIIYLQETLHFDGTELVDELRHAQGMATVRLCEKFVADYDAVVAGAREQQGEPSFFPRRRPSDSEIAAEKTIAEQFDRLRVVDNERYPAFFDYRGKRYVLKIYQASE